jgi:FkbM family methyltransferase
MKFSTSGQNHMDFAELLQYAHRTMRLPLWRLSTARRKLFEAFGSDAYSRPAYGGIDHKLDLYFRDRGVTRGFFVEAGAVDGVFESNTYFLERWRGWDGVLVEPVPEMYRRHRVNRRVRSVNCALVSSTSRETTISITPAHALSRIASTTSSDSAPVITVPARTLGSILDEFGNPRVDLLSLDVEGFELQVLQGLDFKRHRIDTIVIECLTDTSREETHAFLSTDFAFREALTFRDFLYARR